jgi:hypothetical protein
MLLDSQEEVPPPKFCLPENRVASSVAASTVVSASGGPVSLEDPMDTGKCPKCKCPGHFHFIMGLDTACTHLARSLIGSRTLKDALASGSQGYVKKHHALSKCGPSRPLMPEEANDILEGWGADMREQQDWAAAAVYEANGLADFAVVASYACVQSVYGTSVEERWDVSYRLALKDLRPGAPQVGVWVVTLPGNSLAPNEKQDLFASKIPGFRPART